MSEKNPHVIVIAGPNGAGKSTTAPSLLKGTLGVTEFVNADVIALGIENFFRLYRPLTDTWRRYDNSEPSWPRIVADGRGDANETIYDPKTWSLIRGGRI